MRRVTLARRDGCVTPHLTAWESARCDFQATQRKSARMLEPGESTSKRYRVRQFKDWYNDCHTAAECKRTLPKRS